MEAISFSIPSPDKRLVAIRLPANVDAVYHILTGSRNIQSEKSWREQAERTAWKLIQDWIEVQMSMIRMNQAEFIQVFLPYIYNGEKTFYELIKEGGFRMLPIHEKEKS